MAPPAGPDGARRPPLAAILFAEGEIIGGLGRMGAKYLPTIKDQKAGQRFHQKQHVTSKFIKPSGQPPAKKTKKK